MVFSKDGEMIWQCRNCGHIVIGKGAPSICPVCNHPRSFFEIKKEARDKEKLEKYIDNKLEYTSSCIALSLSAIDEAKLSFLEALEAQSEYDELYK